MENRLFVRDCLDKKTLDFLKIEEENLLRSMSGYKGMYDIGDNINHEGLDYKIIDCGELHFASGKYFYKAINEENNKMIYNQY